MSKESSKNLKVNTNTKSHIRRKNKQPRKKVVHTSKPVDNPLSYYHQIYGNQAVQRWYKSNGPKSMISLNREELQKQVTVSKPGDKYEREADEIANRFMRIPEPNLNEKGQSKQELEMVSNDRLFLRSLIQLQINDDKKKEREELRLGILTKKYEGKTIPLKKLSNTITNSSGSALPNNIISEMNNKLGYDFNQVRIHLGENAKVLSNYFNAKAFASGNNIYFGANQFKPNAIEGKKLLVHELVHVIQQNSVSKIMGNAKRYHYNANDTTLFLDSNGMTHKSSDQNQVNNNFIGDERIQKVKMWYKEHESEYTIETVKKIQEKVGTIADGLIGYLTINAIAKWQNMNKLLVDGIAGKLTLIKMFGSDIRINSNKNEVNQSDDLSFFDDLLNIFNYLKAYMTPEKMNRQEKLSNESLMNKENNLIPKQQVKYKIQRKKGFFTELDGKRIDNSLFNKIIEMANYAINNDLVSGDIWLTSGMRSPKKAHRWSTAYQIRQGNVPIQKMYKLKMGKDLDDNIWYQPGWNIKQIISNATKIWDGSLAAEGYKKGDIRREPNTFSGGVTRHATGLAIDAVFPWDAHGKMKNPKKLENLKNRIKNKYKKRPDKLKKSLSLIEKFISRGSYSRLAERMVAKFGLIRPLIHSTSTEDWHYELKK